MKAFLLAAGIGSRLRPITEKIPKCLVPIAGKPLLYHWLTLFEQHHIDEVMINLHHLPDLIFQFLETYSFQVKVHTVFEEELLGSAGTVRNNFDFVCQEQNFLICYADNLTNLDLTHMIRFHERHRAIATIGLFRTQHPRQCGIAELAEDGTVIEFIEKPNQPKSNLAGAGIYVVNHQIWHYLPDRYPSDFGFDVLPQLVGKMKGYRINEYFIDIGTVESYERAKLEFPKLLQQRARMV